MNLYVVVEGEIGEKKVYESWIPFVNPNLITVPTISQIIDNNVYIVSGRGFPNYLEVIRNALFDVAEIRNNKDGGYLFDRLVIAVDSEELTFHEKQTELFEIVNPILESIGRPLDCRIIIQHFCLETWGLGDKCHDIVDKKSANTSWNRIEFSPIILAFFLMDLNATTSRKNR